MFFAIITIGYLVAVIVTQFVVISSRMSSLNKTDELINEENPLERKYQIIKGLY